MIKGRSEGKQNERRRIPAHQARHAAGQHGDVCSEPSARDRKHVASRFLGDWCVTKSDERNTPPPWNYIAYREKVVGPCKNVLAIRKTSIRQGKDNCKMDYNLRTLLHTQLIRYTCRNGKKGFVQIVAEPARRTETGLDMLYIDYAVDQAYWDEQEKVLRP
jgi:hypothetical protein